jgi:hypothetical protein
MKPQSDIPFSRNLLKDIQANGIAANMDGIERAVKDIWMRDRKIVSFILLVNPSDGISIFVPVVEHSRMTDCGNWFALAYAIHCQGITEYLLVCEAWERDPQQNNKIVGEGIHLFHHTKDGVTARYAMIRNGKSVKYLSLPFGPADRVELTADSNPRFHGWATLDKVAAYYGLDRAELQEIWDATVNDPVEGDEQRRQFVRKVFRREMERAEYDGQQETLNGRNDYVAASYILLQSKSGMVRSCCVWRQGNRQALPRTEYVSFMPFKDGLPTSPPPKLSMVPWDHVEKVVGHLMKPMEMKPERHYVDRWPTDDELALLQEYEPDEMTKWSAKQPVREELTKARAELREHKVSNS